MNDEKREGSRGLIGYPGLSGSPPGIDKPLLAPDSVSPINDKERRDRLPDSL